MGALALRTGVWECAPTDEEGIAKWRAGLDGLYPALSVDSLHDRFEGRLRVERNARLQLAEIRSTAQRVVRQPGAVRSRDDEFYKMSLQLEGVGLLIQDGQETVLRPGDVAIYDASRPYLLEFDDASRFLVASFRHGEVWVPRELTAVQLGSAQGVAAVFSRYVSGLLDDLAVLSSPAGPGVSRAFFDLLGAFLAERTEGEVAAGADARVLLRTRAEQLIDERLGDPGLEPRGIAEALHVSVRQLYKLFEATGEPVAARIRRRRIEEAARRLGDPSRRHDTIARIASECGFVDNAYFGRVFRKVHGMSPGAWRSMHLG